MTTKVKLVSITQSLIDVEPDVASRLGIENRKLTPEEHLIYVARVSSPKNQKNIDTTERLLNYCFTHGHVSIFEQVDFSVEITTSKAIAAQLLRHRSAVFQEKCMSGDTEVYFDLSAGTRPNSRRKIYKKTLSYLYDNWNKNEHLKNKIKQMFIRVLDEDTKILTHAHIKEIFQTGIKPIFEIELHNGRKIKCTKDHKVYSEKGFVSLEEGAGLHLINKTAVITNPEFLIGCNGIPCHQSKEWFIEAKQRNIENKKGLKGIAEEAGISYSTARKWIRRHQLQFTKEEIKACAPIVWNKGKTGYKNKPHSIESILKYRASARRGEKSNLWRGGVQRSERLKIADWCGTIRTQKLIEADYKCKECGSNRKLELDHIKPVFSNPELAYDYSNIQVLCKECHDKKHNIAGDYKFWNEARTTTKLTLNWSKIKSVKYVGEEMTYDLEIDHKSHNYVANGVIVHNSARYSAIETFEPIEFRLQDKKNRQNSLDKVGYIDVDSRTVEVYNEDEELKELLDQTEYHLNEISYIYSKLLNKGLAKECARFILPVCHTSTIYMKNNLRNWIHYILARTKDGVQKEHKEVALEIRKILQEHFPITSKALVF